MRRMYSEQELTNVIKAVFDEEVESGVFDEPIADYIDEYISEHPIDPTAITGLDIAPKDVTASGDITADSIIENMSGYSWALETLTTISITPVYAGVVKNGNKLTFVLFAKCVNTSANNVSVGKFTIPEDVASKLYPYQVGTTTSVLSQQELEFFPTSDLTLPPVRCTAEFVKSANNVVLNFRRINTNLVASTEYTFRLERTFLLSENLASE